MSALHDIRYFPVFNIPRRCCEICLSASCFTNLEHSEPEEKLVNNRRKTRLMENNKTNLTGDPSDLNNENKYDMSCLLIRITVCHWNGHISSTTCHTEVQDVFLQDEN